MIDIDGNEHFSIVTHDCMVHAVLIFEMSCIEMGDKTIGILFCRSNYLQKKKGEVWVNFIGICRQDCERTVVELLHMYNICQMGLFVCRESFFGPCTNDSGQKARPGRNAVLVIRGNVRSFIDTLA